MTALLSLPAAVRRAVPVFPWVLGPWAAVVRATLIAAGLASATPLAAQAVDAPTEEQVKTLVAKLDAAFDDRDPDAYLAHFDPTHAEAHAVFRGWLSALLGGRAALQRRSVVRRVERTGAFAIGEVQSTIGLAAGGSGPSFEHHHLLVTRLDGDRTVATLQVEIAPGHSSVAEFRCPACNYRMGGLDGWAVAFLSRDRTRCMEALNFYRLDSDVTVELSVHLADMAEPVAETMSSLCGDLRQMRDDLAFEPARPWTPPAHCEDNLELEGIARTGADATGTLEVFVVVRGAMRFTLCVRGPKAALDARRTEIDDLLTTFELLDKTIGVEDMFAQAASMHTGGGVVERGHYHNAKHRVGFDLPRGWDHVVRPGPFLFRMTLQCPERRNRMWITAYRPAGGRTWHRPLAERMVLDHVTRLGLDKPSSPEWRDAGTGFDLASWRIDDATPQRHVWALLAEDLLLILDGAPADIQTLDEMVQTVRSAERN